MNIPASIRWLRRLFSSWLERAQGGEYIFLLCMAVVIGILGGISALLFDGAIHLFQLGFWKVAEPSIAFLKECPWWQLALIPAVGGLLVGLITTFLVSEARGHGVPEVIKAVALHDGKIRGRVAFAKLLTSSITIGSGGSCGREGPIIQIGAAIGSRIGQALGMSKRRLRTLVGCGAAAGIAATFNAPIAGAIFSIEVILGEFGVAQFSPIVISSVIATVVTRSWRGDMPVFSPPACSFLSAWELFPYLCLGILCGAVSLAYIYLNDRIGGFFERPKMKAPVWLRPAIGGALMGGMAICLPQIMGDGHELTNQAFSGKLPILLLFILVFGKTLATSLTLGSGGSGGVFSPAICIGALLGAWVGTMVEPHMGGGHFGGIAAYSVVGMGGLVAGTMLAPITAILMVFEITSNYTIILPLMMVSTISTIIVMRTTKNNSIYTLKMEKEGVQLIRGGSPDLLRHLPVSQHMKRHFATCHPNEPATDILSRLLEKEFTQIYVIHPGDGTFMGVITLADARRVLLSPSDLASILLAEDLMRRTDVVLTPDDSLSVALSQYGHSGLHELPVIQSSTQRHLVGVLLYTDLLISYQDEILKADTTNALASGISTLTHNRVQIAKGFEIAEWTPPSDILGKTLQEARLPNRFGVRVLLIKRRAADDRRSRVVLPESTTQITPDDTFVILGTTEKLADILPAD